MNILKSKKVRRIGAVALGACVIAGTVLGVGYSQGWFNGSEENIADNGSGFTISDTVNHGISLTSVATQGSGTFDSKTYESSTTIKATVTPSDATDLTVTWSLAWASTSSATISDYVAISSESSSSGESITVYCYQPFSTQIVLTATADAGLTSDVTGSATLDYYKSFTALGGEFPSGLLLVSNDEASEYNYFSDSSYTLSKSSSCYDFLYGTGTLTEDFESVTITFSFNSKGQSYIRSFSSLYSFYSVNSDPTYSVVINSSSSGTVTVYDILGGILGISADTVSSYNSDIYQFLARHPQILSVTAEVVGASSGKTSTIEFDYDVGINPSIFYTEATAVTLNETNLYF